MSKVEALTLTDNCWKECSFVNITTEKFLTKDESEFRTIIMCKHVSMCREIAEIIEKGKEE